MKTVSSLIKLIIFAVVTILAFGTLATTIANVGAGDRVKYSAVFTDATGVAAGQDVRIAGVRVGEINSVQVNSDRTTALIEFSVARSSVLTQGTVATVKYRNLVGERYMALSQGVGDARPMREGEKIGLDRTHAALDLTVLFNGFKPLFAALSPKDVNEFSTLIVEVLQGQGGNINSLLAKTASLTSTLADRDQVIGRTIDNLTAVLGTVDAHNEMFKQLIDQLQRFISGLAADRTTIGASLTNINNLTAETADLLAKGRPAIADDIKQLGVLATTLNKPANTALVEKFLSGSAAKINTITRTATYGSWFNFYMCTFDTATALAPGAPITYNVGGARCS